MITVQKVPITGLFIEKTYLNINLTNQDNIFDLQNTGHYELLSYSPHGTQVDSVMYKCDLSERTVSHAAPPALLQQVRAIINERRGLSNAQNSNKAMTDTPGQVMYYLNMFLLEMRIHLYTYS